MLPDIRWVILMVIRDCNKDEKAINKRFYRFILEKEISRAYISIRRQKNFDIIKKN